MKCLEQLMYVYISCFNVKGQGNVIRQERSELNTAEDIVNTLISD